MSLTAEQERWAEALAISRRHGDDAVAVAAARIEALAADPAGQARWREIASRIVQLRTAASRPLS